MGRSRWTVVIVAAACVAVALMSAAVYLHSRGGSERDARVIGPPNMVDWPERVSCSPGVSREPCEAAGNGGLQLVWILGERAAETPVQFITADLGSGQQTIYVLCRPPEGGTLRCSPYRVLGTPKANRAAIYWGLPPGG